MNSLVSWFTIRNWCFLHIRRSLFLLIKCRELLTLSAAFSCRDEPVNDGWSGCDGCAMCDLSSWLISRFCSELCTVNLQYVSAAVYIRTLTSFQTVVWRILWILKSSWANIVYEYDQGFSFEVLQTRFSGEKSQPPLQKWR